MGFKELLRQGGVLFADRLNCRVTAFGIQLPHDAMNVILDGELGEMQASGDFLVCEAAREKGHQLLLPGREAEFSAEALIQNHRALARSPRDELK